MKCGRSIGAEFFESNARESHLFDFYIMADWSGGARRRGGRWPSGSVPWCASGQAYISLGKNGRQNHGSISPLHWHLLSFAEPSDRIGSDENTLNTRK
jgi:hypothetical protein